MNLLFTVCGRAGSKGVKNKNLKDFLGIPLMYYTLASILLYKERYGEKDEIDVVLNTDSEELIALAGKQKQLDVQIIRRAGNLGGDDVPKVSVIKDCMNQCEKKNDKKYDAVVDLDITSPLRTIEDIYRAVMLKMEREDTDLVETVTPSRRSPYFNMVKEENGFYVRVIESEYTSRQQAPVLYDENASIYVYSVRALREKDDIAFFNDGIDAVLTKDTAVLDIDSEEDFELLEVLAQYFYTKYPEYGELKIRAEALNHHE